MRVLGISPAHDASVCLYENGKILSFYKEERLSRKKRDRIPIRSIYKTLTENCKDIDAIAFCSVITPELSEFYGYIVEKFVSCSSIIDYSHEHHLQHASLAFYNSGFEEAAVVVIDRNGSAIEGGRESETIFHASYPNNFKTVYKNYWVFNNSIYQSIKNMQESFEIDAQSMYGIVKVYESATSLIGQESLENGKTMGLSSYGKPNNNFPNLFVNDTNIPNDFYFSHISMFGDYMSSFKEFEKFTTNEITENNYELYADFAYQVQKQTQAAVAYLIKKAIDKTKSKNVVLSGGYALNVLANSFFVEKFPDINFYFEPIADDSGNSIGGAMHLYRSLSMDTNIYPIKDTFIHGVNHDLSSITGTNCSENDISMMLSEYKSIAIFEGRAEGGPRALGHRSILFDPSHPSSKDLVNKIKKREWYRPFAAVVLEEDVEEYFFMGSTKTSPFMTMAFQCKENTRSMFPGIVHIDNSCRIQTVNKSNPTLYSLLKTHKNNFGYGILLNTSFNLAGEPLVESPEEAIETLKKSDLDHIWFPEIGIIV